jgi:T-complex protein 1 subunit eta
MEETERSLHDAIMIVRRAIKSDAVVAGGGAIEMELSKFLRDHSRAIAGKEQLIFAAMAKALEIIPRQLCDNAGFDATNILNKLRQKHAQVRITQECFELKLVVINYHVYRVIAGMELTL